MRPAARRADRHPGGRRPERQQGALDLAHDLGLDTALFAWEDLADRRYAVANDQRYLGYDDPAEMTVLRASLAASPLTPRTTTTALAPTTVADRTLRGRKAVRPRVMGTSGLVPVSAQGHLLAAELSVRIQATRSGSLDLLPGGARSAEDRVRVRFAAGSHTVSVSVAPGDEGRLRVVASRRIEARIRLVGYTRVDY